mmetsp:Transcript_22817/g.52598  ORF Transcript_22817/g.52598 Transcript_22817/m.52598 type:complete len:366 (+) Transcript_22817:756-1853(+)
MRGPWAPARAKRGLLHCARPHRLARAATLGARTPTAPSAQDAVPVARLDVASLGLLRALARLAVVLRGHFDVPRALPHAAAAPRRTRAPSAPSAQLAIYRARLRVALLCGLERRARRPAVGGNGDGAAELARAAAARPGALRDDPFADGAIRDEDLRPLHLVQLASDLRQGAELAARLVLLGAALRHGARELLLQLRMLSAPECGLRLRLDLRLRRCREGCLGLPQLVPQARELAHKARVRLLAIVLQLRQAPCELVEAVADAALHEEEAVAQAAAAPLREAAAARRRTIHGLRGHRRWLDAEAVVGGVALLGRRLHDDGHVLHLLLRQRHAIVLLRIAVLAIAILIVVPHRRLELLLHVATRDV